MPVHNHRDDRRARAITGLQASAWALSPMSTPAKKTDEYFKLTMHKANCWWVVDCGDDPYGTL